MVPTSPWPATHGTKVGTGDHSTVPSEAALSRVFLYSCVQSALELNQWEKFSWRCQAQRVKKSPLSSLPLLCEQPGQGKWAQKSPRSASPLSRQDEFSSLAYEVICIFGLLPS